MSRRALFTSLLCIVASGLNCGGSREPLPSRKGQSTSIGGAGEGGATGTAASAAAANSVAGSAGTADISNDIPATCSGLDGNITEQIASDVDSLTGLREIGKPIGAAVAARRLSEVAYANTIAREFNWVTPENEMKWDALEPSPGNFNFANADTLVKFAQQHGMKVRGHTLVWHKQLPSWVSDLVGADAMRAALKRHIEGVMGHYRDQFPGVVVAWDVVNEALDASVDGAKVVRDSPFSRELGEGFIAEAYQIAHNADPNVQLYYNDYGIEGMSPKATVVFETLRDWVASGVPVSGVGFQMHTRADDRGPKLEDFKTNLMRYGELGLPVNISEMDVSICQLTVTLPERLEMQRLRYNAIAAACLQSSICKSITVWGVNDGGSWLTADVPNCTNGTSPASPLLFDDQFKRKAAWVGLSDALLGCSR